ncbi:MAG TPA: hypothetical protein PL056_07335 [bacterium]|nr:hypothetical protein [bacterium]
MFRVMIVSIFGLFFISCGISVGFAQTHGGTSLSYQVPVKDMKFEGEVSSTVKGPSVFCIFPAYKPLMKQAMEKLNAQAGLKNGNKAVFNVRADVEDKFYLFWCTRHVTVSGDVYRIVDDKELEKEKIMQATRQELAKQDQIRQEKKNEEQNELQKKRDEEEKKRLSIEKIPDSELKKPEERQKFLSKYWEALKNKNLMMIKNEVVYSLMSKPGYVKQEGFYFLGDAALIEKDIAAAENHYRKGLSMEGADQEALKFHLQQLGLMMPELKESIQAIYNKVVK